MASLRSRTAVAVLLMLTTLALTASAYSIWDFPEVDCAVADLQHCSQCHAFAYGGVTYYLCAICDDTDSQQYSQATQGEAAGTCVPYDSTKCTVSGCHKCAADDDTKCVACEYGVPDQDTAECLGQSISSATDGRYTSAAPTTTSTTTTTTKAPTTTTTTTSTTTTTTTTKPPTTTTTTTTKPPTTTTTTTTKPPTTSTTSTTKSPTTSTTTTTSAPTTSTSTTTTSKPPTTSTTSTSTTTSAPTPSTSTTTTSKSPTTSTTTTTAMCTVANCLNCTSNGAVCDTCLLGYTVTSTGACMQSGYCAVTNCAQCSATSANMCTSCIAGYARNSNGGCSRKSSNASASRVSVVSAVVALAFVAAADLI